MRLVATKNSEHVLAFLRPGADAPHDVLVVLNFSDRELRVELASDDARRVLKRFKHPRDLLTDSKLRTLRVPAHGSLIVQQSQ